MQCLTITEFKAIIDILPITGRTLTTQNLTAAVTLVAKQRMADVTHVGTYLVGTTRLSKTLQHTVVCHSTLANVRTRWEDSHSQTVLGVSTNIAFYTSAILGEVSPH